MTEAATTAEVVIIGAGIVGAALASELAVDHDVLVVEAEAQPDRHSTGRSAAVWRLIYGDAEISELIAAGRDFLESPPFDFSEHSFLRPRPVLYVAQNDELDASSSLYTLGERMQPALHRISVDEAYRMCPALRSTVAEAFVDPTGADIDVAGLHQAYLRRAKRRGGRVELSHRVDGLRRFRGAWQVSTSQGLVKAQSVVNAAGAWGDVVAAMAGAAPVGLTPMRRTVITFDPGELRNDEGPMVVSVSNRYYFKPETGTVLASPMDEHPDDPHNVKPAELDVARLLDRLSQATAYPTRSIQSSWAGLRSFCPDRRPALGWDDDRPGFFWAIGLGGFGIETSPGVSQLCSRLFNDPSALSPPAFAPNRFAD